METPPTPADPPAVPRLETGVPGLDAVLDGGLLAGTLCLVVGPPGSGKTTLGNQVAFHHAAQGGVAVFATVLAESHERMLARLRAFRFFAPDLVGARVHYLSLLDALDAGGLDGVLAAIREALRARSATLLVVDGASLLEAIAPSLVDFRRFVQRLQATASLAGCTTLLLSARAPTDAGPAGPHADGVLVLGLDPVGVRDVRTLRAVKLRGAQHLTGRHDVAITGAGMAVHPRLEAMAGAARPAPADAERLGFGVPGLDAMLGGGLLPGTSTMVLGTPGSGKTLCGLHFLAAGAARGEPGLVATFHEPEALLARTAAKIGLDLAGPIETGLVRVLWRPPLEESPDAWAWDLLAEVARHRPRRLLVDGLSDVQRLILLPERLPPFVAALVNELRLRGATTLMTVEIDAYVGSELAAPVPAASATMDNGLLLRHVEIRSRVHRLVSVLKARESATDLTIRELIVGPGGLEVGGVFDGAAALMTGVAAPDPIPSVAARPGEGGA